MKTNTIIDTAKRAYIRPKVRGVELESDKMLAGSTEEEKITNQFIDDENDVW